MKQISKARRQRPLKNIPAGCYCILDHDSFVLNQRYFDKFQQKHRYNIYSAMLGTWHNYTMDASKGIYK